MATEPSPTTLDSTSSPEHITFKCQSELEVNIESITKNEAPKSSLSEKSKNGTRKVDNRSTDHMERMSKIRKGLAQKKKKKLEPTTLEDAKKNEVTESTTLEDAKKNEVTEFTGSVTIEDDNDDEISIDQMKKIGDSFEKSEAIDKMIEGMQEIRQMIAPAEPLGEGSENVALDMEGIDKDDIKNEVQKAISNITKNPNQMTEIVEGIKSQPGVMRGVLNYIRQNPDLQSKAMDSMAGNAPTMQQISRMSKKEREALKSKACEAKKQIDSMNPNVATAVIINASRKVKNLPIGAYFPDGSQFSDGVIEELRDGISYIYRPSDKRVNKLSSKIVGKKIGEIVIFRETEDGTIGNYNISDFYNDFPDSRK